MEDQDINAAAVGRYYHALVSAYASIGKPATSAASASKAAAFPAHPDDIFHEKDKQTFIKELTEKIDSLETQLRDMHPDGEIEKQRLRRLETRLDIFRARLERLQFPAQGQAQDQNKPLEWMKELGLGKD